MHRCFVILALLGVPTALAAQSPAAPGPDPRLAAIVATPSAERIERDIRTLVGFGTRHTLSDTLSARRGIGAARRWLFAELERTSQSCGGCLEVRYVSEVYPPQRRVPSPTNVVSVIAIQRGATDPGRVVIVSGHYDSRASASDDVATDAPGADDDGSGTAVVLATARALSRYRFAATIIYAAFAGEEQGLLGSGTLARMARDSGWRVEAVLNNDIVGNTRGSDGWTDDTRLRVFSDAVPPTETERERAARRSAGGEVDGISRQIARYVDRIADRWLPGFDVWMIYRHDRFGRGGDHRSFNDLGFAAVRLSEMHEHFDRQHQNVRVENGRAYGDTPDFVDYRYVSRVAALNAASLASLAWAPAPPRAARIAGGGTPAAHLRWTAPEDSANVAGYRVYWRRTDAPTWENGRDIGRQTEWTFEGLSIDNWYFGVASVSRDGYESPVVFPTAGNRE